MFVAFSSLVGVRSAGRRASPRYENKKNLLAFFLKPRLELLRQKKDKTYLKIKD